MENRQLKALDDSEVIDALVLYFRAKSLLSRGGVQNILKGKTQSPNFDVLNAYAAFVDRIDKTVVLANGKKLRYWENFIKEVDESYRKQLKKGHSGNEPMTRRQISGYEVLRDDPFNAGLKEYIRTYMKPELSAVIKDALNSDKATLETVRGLRMTLGRTQRQSYADVVLESLYVGTRLSGLESERNSLQTQVAELKKKVETGKKLDNIEASLIASFTSLLSANTNVLTDSMRAGIDTVRSDIQTLQNSVNDVLTAIDTQNTTLRTENARLAKSGKVKNIVIAGGALALALALTFGGIEFAQIQNYKGAEAGYHETIENLNSTIADKDAQIAKLNQDYAEILEKYNALLSTPSQDAQVYVDFIKSVDEVVKEMHYSLLLADGETEHRLSEEEKQSILAKIDALGKMQGAVGEYAKSLGISLGGLVVNIERLQSQADELSVKVAGFEKRVAELEEKGRADAATIAALEGEKASLEAQIKALQDQLDAATGTGADAALIQELRDQIAELTEKLTTAESNLAKVTVERDQALTENAALKTSISELQDKIVQLEDALKNAVSQEQIDAIQKELDETKAQLAAVTAEKNELLEEIEDYKTEIAGLKTDNAEAAAKLAEAIETCKNLQAALDSANADLADAQQVIAELRAEIAGKLAEAYANEDFIRELYYQITYSNGAGMTVAQMRDAINSYLGIGADKDLSGAEQDQFVNGK